MIKKRWIGHFTHLKSSLMFESVFAYFRESELTTDGQENMKLTRGYKDN